MSNGHIHTCDIFIPSKNMIIECDGCFWHGCENCGHNKHKISLRSKKNDSIINDEIINQGYILHRFWEHDIIHNMEIINACL